MNELSSDHAIVEREGPVADDLVVLVSFAGDDDDIAPACQRERGPDRFAAIRLEPIGCRTALQAGLDFPQDLQGIFRARVVGGGDDEVAPPRGNLSHQGAFLAIPVAAASEDGDHAAPGELPDCLQEFLQRIRRVGIIDDYREILAAPNQFQPPRHAVQRFDALADVDRIHAKAEGCAGGGHDVVDIGCPTRRELTAQFAAGCREAQDSCL